MSYSNGPSVIKSGLVFCFDAANPKSYVSGSTSSYDLSGNSGAGKIYGTSSYDTSSMGNISMDGSSSYIDCGSNSVLNVGNNITVLAWVKITASLSSFQTFVSKVSGGYTTGWELDSNYGAGVRCTLRPSATMMNAQDGTAFVLNTWFMCGFSFDGTTLIIYHNGIQTASTTSGGPVILNSSASLQLSGRFGTNAALTGNFGMAQIYNRALSAYEVRQNYDATKGRFGLS